MPPTTRRTSNGGVIRRWHGRVTAEDQVASAGEYIELMGEQPLAYAIVDYRNVQTFEPQRKDIQRIADRLHKLVDTRLVVIAPQDLVYGMVRMFDLSLSDEARPWQLRVVRSVDEALAWLEEQLPGLDFSEARAALNDPEQM
jgi:hypothetical protein